MTELAHERNGSGPPLLLVHGLGSQRQVWNPVLPALASERQTIAFDLPGFGDSPPLEAGLRPTPAALSDAVEAFLDELGLPRVAVAGNSLGGWIALELAGRGRASSAVAISPAGFWNEREARYASASFVGARALLRGLRPVLPRVATSRGARTLLTSQYFARPWCVPPEDALGAMRNCADSPALHATRRELFSRRYEPGRPIDVPVTIAWGTHDWLLLPRQGERARRLLPAARFVPLTGLGHIPFWDDPELVAQVILDATPAARRRFERRPHDQLIRR